MTRIAAPDSGMGEHIDWALLRPKMAAGMGKLSEAVYGNSQLSVREREAARWTIALINDCAVCRDTRARDGAAAGAGEPFYDEVSDWRTAPDRGVHHDVWPPGRPEPAVRAGRCGRSGLATRWAPA